MSQYRFVNTKFWDDPYIDDLDPIEKLLYLYFLTNAHTNIAGIYEISMKRITQNTGIDATMVKKMTDKFSRDGKIYYTADYVIIKNFIKNQKPNSKIEIGILATIEALPDKLKKLVKLDDKGLWLDLLEVGGKLNMLDERINAKWAQAIKDKQEQDKKMRTLRSKRSQ